MPLNLQFVLWLLLVAIAVASYRKWKQSRLRHACLLAAILAYFGSAPVASNFVTLFLEERYPSPSLVDLQRDEHNTILVLTGGWLHRNGSSYEVRIGEDGWERLQAALLLHDRIGGRILFSGAPSPDGSTSVARVMAEVAAREGVAANEILIEERSENTYENILFSMPLIGASTGRVWLVTTAFRMPRAVAVARRQGLNVIPYPCDFRAERHITWRAWLPASHAPLALENSLHEIVGWLVYRWHGWA